MGSYQPAMSRISNGSAFIGRPSWAASISNVNRGPRADDPDGLGVPDETDELVEAEETAAPGVLGPRSATIGRTTIPVSEVTSEPTKKPLSNAAFDSAPMSTLARMQPPRPESVSSPTRLRNARAAVGSSNSSRLVAWTPNPQPNSPSPPISGWRRTLRFTRSGAPSSVSQPCWRSAAIATRLSSASRVVNERMAATEACGSHIRSKLQTGCRPWIQREASPAPLGWCSRVRCRETVAMRPSPASNCHRRGSPDGQSAASSSQYRSQKSAAGKCNSASSEKTTARGPSASSS